MLCNATHRAIRCAYCNRSILSVVHCAPTFFAARRVNRPSGKGENNCLQANNAPMGQTCQGKSYQWDKILAKCVLIVHSYLIMATKQREVCICNVCGHTWLPEQENSLPARCASCKSSRWNREKPSSKPEKTTSKPVLGEILEDSHCETQPSTKPERIAAKPHSAKHSRAQVKSSTKQSKSPRLQSGNCRHGFMVIDGVTACSECRS